VPEIGLILGSGLGAFGDDKITVDRLVIRYEDVPNFPRSTVEGHKGQFVLGKVGDKRVICMQGRFHFYEGYTMQQVTMPIRVMAQLGVKSLIVTCAAGGINKEFSSGALMLINDHINNMGTNPLIGPCYAAPRFPDMTYAYDRRLFATAQAAADELGIKVESGVYLANTGPSYETPAEIRMMRQMGADAVGMSTVPEVIVANHAGLKVVGIACVTNAAAGILDQPLNHEEVTETSKRVTGKFTALVEGLINKM